MLPTRPPNFEILSNTSFYYTWVYSPCSRRDLLFFREKVLYSFDLSTEEAYPLTDKGSYTHPIYSKDGTSFAVNRKVKDTYDLVVMTNGKEETIVSEIISYSPPDWVANDSKLLFVTSVNGNQEVFSVDLETRKKNN